MNLLMDPAVIGTPAQFILRRRMTQINARVRAVTPIFGVSDRNRPTGIGSGVLLRLFDRFFICTAKHVIDENKETTLYFDGSNGIEELLGVFWSEPHYDISVRSLSPTEVQKFGRYTFLEQDDLFLRSSIVPHTLLTAVGFPVSQYKIYYDRDLIRARMLTHTDMLIGSAGGRLRVRFNKKRVKRFGERSIVSSPDPFGMSGGGLFGGPATIGTSGNSSLLLYGISTDWAIYSNYIRGTQTTVLFHFIRKLVVDGIV